MKINVFPLTTWSKVRVNRLYVKAWPVGKWPNAPVQTIQKDHTHV